MDSDSTNTTAKKQQRKAACINVARERYVVARKQGWVNVSLTAKEAQERANRSVFRLT